MCVCEPPLRPFLSSLASWSCYGFNSNITKKTKSVSRVAGRNQAVTSLLIQVPELRETSCKHCLADAYLTNSSSEEILALDLGGICMQELEKWGKFTQISQWDLKHFWAVACWFCTLYFVQMYMWEINIRYATMQSVKLDFIPCDWVSNVKNESIYWPQIELHANQKHGKV